MWWLLVPLIGAVVTAVASSDNDDKEATERRAQKEAESQAIARRKQERLEKRKVQLKAQLIADVGDQLNDLFTTHPAVIERIEVAPRGISFNTLKTFANKKVPNEPNTMLKHLEILVPGTAFSPIWNAHAFEAQELQKEINDLKLLKEKLRGQAFND